MVDRLAAQMESRAASPANPVAVAVGGPGSPSGSAGASTPGPSPSNPNASYPRSTGTLAPGQGTPQVPAPSDKDNMPYKAFNFPLKARFGPGFEFRTEDDEYILQFHNLTQVDGRFYEQGGQNPVKDTFAIPRQWFMFSGRLGKPYEYFVSIQNTLDVVNMLDVFGNIHYDDRLQFKLGRFKTPFTYEFYALPVQGLVQPERSLFFNNFALNRSEGVQAWGQLFDKRVDYAAGAFNSIRNSYLDSDDGKNVLAYLNYRPFLLEVDSPFQYLNIGGSVMTGDINALPSPISLRTNVATSGNSIVGPQFLTYNANTRENGDRMYWDLHAAWYYKQLSLIGEWQSGRTTYSLANQPLRRTRVPVESFYVQAGYFLTGETVAGRNVVNPIRPFDLRPGHQGYGALELTGRYNYLTMGREIFTGGFADPNLWTNNLYLTDLGFNWYWTQNIKWVFQWEHAVFGNPVLFAPGRLQRTNDSFLFRFQIFF